VTKLGLLAIITSIWLENMPLPIKLLHWFINRVKRPALTIGAVFFGTLLGFFLITGSFYPEELLDYQSSPLEATGLFLLLSILPAYLMICLVSLIRNTANMSKSIGRILPENQYFLLAKIDQAKFWPVWVALAMLFAGLGNISWESLYFDFTHELFWYSLSVVIGQFVLWAVVGLVLAVNFHNSILLNKLSKVVEIDIYNLDSLNPFGRSGLTGLLIIMGALAFTPLQSIDAEFRWDNYYNALVICIPAAIAFMILPTWPLHKRIRQEKQTGMNCINDEISRASKSLENSELNQLNALLDRRNYLQHCRNWPMDLSIFSRVVFYILIPPLAWVGAALMELALDSYLVG
jgi:hypothetical protein